VLEEIKKGFLNKIIPKITEEGISGSYFLENLNRHRVAIFKPLDEEPYAPNNPKGYVGNLPLIYIWFKNWETLYLAWFKKKELLFFQWYSGKMGQKGIRSGIRSGEQGYREVVACALDPH